MKKLYLFFILLGSGYAGLSQNQYPTEKNSSVRIDGGSVNLIKPSTTGGWARGINYFNDLDNTTFGGFGLYGGGETPIRLYMTHGQNPWSGKGLYVLTNGNTGIGTTNPISRLEVNGDISLPRTRKIKFLETINGDDRAYIRSTYGQNGEDYNSLVFAVGAGDESVMIKSNGNVGIRTLSPDARLAVNGIVHSKEVKVDLTGWSDFVFEDSYNLPTLEKVEQHIREKGRLKDIPSAKEVEENGIFLGEMDAKLLQKIEELTLYVIELKKENEQQQKQIEILIEQFKEK